MQKYNIALLPTVEGSKIISLAQHFSLEANQYLLGKNSLPHVTLYQFWEKPANIEKVWNKIISIWNFKNIQLNFSKFSYFSRDNKIFYISLLPEEVLILHQMHGVISAGLNLATKSSFDPHMTLFNTHHENLKLETEISYLPLSDKFILALGSCDNIGQFIKTLFSKDK